MPLCRGPASRFIELAYSLKRLPVAVDIIIVLSQPIRSSHRFKDHDLAFPVIAVRTTKMLAPHCPQLPVLIVHQINLGSLLFFRLVPSIKCAFWDWRLVDPRQPILLILLIFISRLFQASLAN